MENYKKRNREIFPEYCQVNNMPGALRNQVSFDCETKNREATCLSKYYNKKWFSKVCIDNLRIILTEEEYTFLESVN